MTELIMRVSEKDGKTEVTPMRVLVRCKDCEAYNGDHRYCANDIFAIIDGYCHYGRRREE